MITPPYDRETPAKGHCSCRFDPYPEGSDDYGEVSWHHRRCCEFCGNDDWWTLACPHAKPRTCPSCGEIQKLVPFHAREEVVYLSRPLATWSDPEGWGIVTKASHPTLFLAFEEVSLEAGYGSGHSNYGVELRWWPMVDAVEAALKALDYRELVYLVDADTDKARQIAGRSPELLAAFNMMCSFHEDWQIAP